MKDSGIDWIGEIPEHWSVLKINHFGVVTLGKMLTPDEKEGYVLKPYLRSQNIQKERVDVSDVKEMWFTKSELLKLKLLKGDLLLNEGGDVGRTCIWNEELENCYIQNSVNRLRFIDDLQEYYLYLSNIYHFVGYYDSIVNRVSIPHLTKEKLESVKFIRPTRKEQSQIVEHLDIKTKEIDDLVHLEQKKIDLLKEYRQSLISEVVTGKIKVTQ
jgi:type I restriction enzyme S subunit